MERFGLLKATSRLSNHWHATRTPMDNDNPQPRGMQSRPLGTDASLITPRRAEHGSQRRAEHTSTLLAPQPRNVNVVLVAETGVGKSSVINLIAQSEVAQVSSDTDGYTMQSTRYDIPFDGINFAIFETIGLNEPKLGVNEYLKATEKAYELIRDLTTAGGLHLLLFCMRGGRISSTTQRNYQLFAEYLRGTKVPIALVFTGLEMETEMEDWWKRNQIHVERYGIRSVGHACITALQDDTPEQMIKYTTSQRKIRQLLKDCALKDGSPSPESLSWFAGLAKGMRRFLVKDNTPKRRDILKVLTQRCKLDSDTAKKIADMIEKEDNTLKVAFEGVAAGLPINVKPNFSSEMVDTDAETKSIGGYGFASEVTDTGRDDKETKDWKLGAQAGVMLGSSIGGMEGGSEGGNDASPVQLCDTGVVPDESQVAFMAPVEDHLRFGRKTLKPLPSVNGRPSRKSWFGADQSVIPPQVDTMWRAVGSSVSGWRQSSVNRNSQSSILNT